jgi:hypothetical protein
MMNEPNPFVEDAGCQDVSGRVAKYIVQNVVDETCPGCDLHWTLLAIDYLELTHFPASHTHAIPPEYQ